MALRNPATSAPRIQVDADDTPSSITACFNLTPAMVREARARLRWIGLLSLSSSVFFPIVGKLIHLPPPSSAEGSLLIFGSVAVCALGGLALALLAGSSRVPSFVVLRAGILYQYIAALASQLIRLGDEVYRDALTSNAYDMLLPLIVIFGFTIPAKARVAFPISLITATMAPMTYAMFLRMDLVPPLDAMGWVLRFLPVYITAIITAVLSTKFYALGRSLESAKQVGSYKLTNLIGKGGMGEVWRAEHRMLARCSAIKLVKPEVIGPLTQGSSGSQTAVMRFEREARATAALRSPHSIEIYDFGVTQDGRFYYVMELLDGMDLDSLVKRFGPLPAARVIYFLVQVCDSLAEAHDLGLVHRDIKPKNIFNCRMGKSFDFIKVLDFGLVKDISNHDDQHLTQEGTTTGTPAYLAPEAARGSKEIDARSDIYSLGCVAYWLLTGQPVFEGTTSVATILKHVTEAPIPPSQRTDNPVPEDLEAVVMRCLEKDPASRPQSADELSAMLSRCKDAHSWRRKEAREWWYTHLPSSLTPQTSTCGTVQTLSIDLPEESSSHAPTLS
jgi:serine/threonine protein kinase